VETHDTTKLEENIENIPVLPQEEAETQTEWLMASTARDKHT
jgi:hypothetical protein